MLSGLGGEGHRGADHVSKRTFFFLLFPTPFRPYGARWDYYVPAIL